MRKLRKRILIALGITAAILLIAYLGRRPFFEGMIITRAESAIEAALGVEVSIGAVRGNWLTRLVVEDVNLQGGADSAYRGIEDLDIDLSFSPFALMSGDLRGLHRLQVHARRVHLDTSKRWTRPGDARASETDAATALSDLLGMFRGGATIEVDELALLPEYVASNRLGITLLPGKSRRSVSIVTGETELTGSIATTGEFAADCKGREAGRLLRALGIGDTVDRGSFTGNIKGNSTDAHFDSSFALATRLNNGEAVRLQYGIQLQDGRLRAPQLRVELPGISVSGDQLDIPLGDLTGETFRSLLGSLKVKITDLTHYRVMLPQPVRQFLPITGDLGVHFDKGVVKLQPCMLAGKGFRLRVEAGSVSLVETTSGALTLDKLRGARANGIGFELIIPEPLAIPVANGSPLVLAGRIRAKVSGGLHDVDATANVDLQNLRFREFDVDTLTGKIAFDGDRVTLSDARIRGARRRTDDFRFAVEGGGAFILAKAGAPARVTLELRGAAPPEVLALANLPGSFVAKLKLPPVTIRVDLALPSSGSPLGDIELDLPGLSLDGLSPLDLTCRASLASGNVVRIADLSLHGADGGVRARGEFDTDDGRLDLTADGKLDRLLPVIHSLGLPDLDGSVEITKLTAKGTFSPLPNVTISGSAALSTISPSLFPASIRNEMPATPLELSFTASASPAGFDVAALRLAWGQADRRIVIGGRGPLPLRLTKRGLEAAKRDRPFAFDWRASVDKPRPGLGLGKVAADGTGEIDAREVRIPVLTTRAADGSLAVRGLRAGIEIGKLFDGSIAWPDVAIAGAMQLRGFEIGTFAGAMLEKAADVHGAVSGDLTFDGRIGQPRLEGAITLQRGGISFPGAPRVESLTGTARFAATSVDLTYKARTSDGAPLALAAGFRTGTQPLYTALTDRGAPFSGEIRIEGFDLALLRESVPSLPDLHGKVGITGTVKGSIANLQPDVTLTLRDAGWRLPDSKEKIDGLAATVRFTRDEVKISDVRGDVPGTDLKLAVAGRFKVENAALWEYATTANPKGSGSFEFSQVPLDLLPRKNGLEAAGGVVDGKLELTGTWADLNPALTARIQNAALKIRSIPRIRGLSAQLVADYDGATLTGKATMGAGPFTVAAKFTPGKDKRLLQAYAAGALEATVKGQRMLLTRSGGLKLRGDVDLHARGGLDKINVGGVITLDDSKYIKRLSLVPDLKVTSGASTGNPFGPWAIAGGDRVVFDVAVKTHGPVVLRTNVIDTALDLNCRLQGQCSALSLTGACTSRTGTIRFPGMGMRISTMRLMFKGGAQPGILVIASGQRHGVRINLRLDGPIDDATPKLSSSPALQPRDLWSLITTGARPATLAKNSAASNTALLATYVIQELVLTYFASESTEASQSFISRFTFEFGRELSRDGAETWDVNFDIGKLWYVPPRFGLRFERDVYEDYNLGLVYRWRF